MEGSFADSGPAGHNSLEADVQARRLEEANARRRVIREQIQEGRSRHEILHEALEAARAESRVQARRLEQAKAQLQALTAWIETGRPQREVLRDSAYARMQARLESLPVIEQAKGVLMAQQRCGPDEAFDLLRRASQRANLKLHVLAAQIVAQAASPPASTSAPPTQPAAMRHPGPERAGRYRDRVHLGRG